MLVSNHGTGWIRDYPDFRDLEFSSDSVRPLLELALGSSAVELVEAHKLQRLKLPTSANLQEDFTPIEDQGKIECCTAHVVTSIAEYLCKKANNEQASYSRLFLYKVTKNLLKTKGNVGVFLRTTIGAVRLFGLPPEEYWPFDVAKHDEEPPAFCYAFASNYKALKYVRLDAPGIPPDELLKTIKLQLAAGFPLAFGTVLFDGPIAHSNSTKTPGQIPFPHSKDQSKGGHAMVAVGYDDSIVIQNPKSEVATTGAIRIRNSWGTGWGEEGYGWLPYAYISSNLSVDWWALLSQDWVKTGEFGLNF